MVCDGDFLPNEEDVLPSNVRLVYLQDCNSKLKTWTKVRVICPDDSTPTLTSLPKTLPYPSQAKMHEVHPTPTQALTSLQADDVQVVGMSTPLPTPRPDSVDVDDMRQLFPTSCPDPVEVVDMSQLLPERHPKKTKIHPIKKGETLPFASKDEEDDVMIISIAIPSSSVGILIMVLSIIFRRKIRLWIRLRCPRLDNDEGIENVALVDVTYLNSERPVPTTPAANEASTFSTSSTSPGPRPSTSFAPLKEDSKYSTPIANSRSVPNFDLSPISKADAHFDQKGHVGKNKGGKKADKTHRKVIEKAEDNGSAFPNRGRVSPTPPCTSSPTNLTTTPAREGGDLKGVLQMILYGSDDSGSIHEAENKSQEEDLTDTLTEN